MSLKLTRCALALALGALFLYPVASGAQESPLTGRTSGGQQELTFSVNKARAYSYKTALRKETIEVLGLSPCDPENDPYQCDRSRYNKEPNCPEPIQLGPQDMAPEPKPPAGVTGESGRSGDKAGVAPEEATPVQIERLLADGGIAKVPGILGAAGLASSIFVDVSGRVRPDGHTTTDAFSAEAANYEERCFPDQQAGDGGVDPNNYEHFLSRSGQTPATYHLAECVGKACNLGAGIGAERAQNIVALEERDGVVTGQLLAELDGLTFAGGVLRVDTLLTHVSFTSDGTAEGLTWTAQTTASGASVGGVPVALPPGETVAGPGFSVGVAQPYVEAAEDGSALTIVALGLQFGNKEQDASIGGAELVTTMDRVDPFAFAAGDLGDPGDLGADNGASDNGASESLSAPSDNGAGGGEGTGGGGGSFLPDGADLGTAQTGDLPGSTQAAAPAPQDALPPETSLRLASTLVIYERPTGLGIGPAIVGAGVLAGALITLRWLRRYPWGRRLHRFPPLRGTDWLYRAFIQT